MKMKSLLGIIATLMLMIQCFKAQDSPDPSPSRGSGDNCNEAFNGNEGLFSTKGFPEDYLDKSNCTWKITGPENHKIQLTFHLLNIEHHQSCGWDWVKVFESNGTILKHVCGYLQQDLIVTSTNNSLSVQFYSDSVIQAAGFLASWIAVPEDEENPNGNQITENDSLNEEPGYVLSFPQSFTIKNSDAPEENICLQLINVQHEGEVEIKFYSGKQILEDNPSVVKSIPYNAQKLEKMNCFQMQLPEDFEDGTAVLRIKGTFGNYKILSYKSVRVIKSSTLSLIQSDKFDYRPKQDVKFRIMLLDAELKPSQKVNMIQEIWISDPANNRLKQWKNIDTKQGIANFSMKLDEEPPLGEWHINAKFGINGTQEEKAAFTVSENILPKFEVNIESPEVVYRDTEEQAFTICATYTHGSKVKGSLNTTFVVQYKETYWRSPIKFVKINKLVDELVNGCATVSLNNTEILQFAAKSTDLKIIAVVEEAVTGIKQNVTKSTSIKDIPFILDFGASSKEHIVAPGAFPYVGRVKAVRHSTETLAHVRLEICARLFTSLDKMRSYVNRNNYQFYNFDEDQFYELAKKIEKLKYKESCDEYWTNRDGIVDFSVKLGNNISTEVTKLSFKITALDYKSNSTNGMKQPVEKLDVSLTHANASSSLTIHNIKEGLDLKCNDANDENDSNKIPVYFSARPSSTLMLTYYFTSSGSIVRQGSKKIEVSNQDMSSEYVGHANKIDLSDGMDSLRDEIITKFDIDLKLPLDNGNQGRISNKLNLLVYSRDEDGTILTSSQEFSTKSCKQATSPKISWSSEKVSPSTNVQFTLKGSGDAYCGYSIVDKSVNLVPNPNKVTTPRLQQLKEDLAKLRVVNSQVADKCKDATLVFKSFERLGLFVLSDKLLQNTVCDTLVDVTSITKQRESNYPYPVPEYDGDEEYFDDVVQPESISFNRVAAESSAYGEGGLKSEGGPPGSPPRNRNKVASGSGPRPQIRKPKVELRNYFPETWLFDLVELNSDGENTLSLETPHTITTWVAEAVCTDSVNGMQVSEVANLLVTQDFFSDLNMPYSVKRGEKFQLNVSIFNTIEQKLPITITLKKSQLYKVGRQSDSICLQPQDNHIETFVVKAKELHEVNITVEAKISSSDNIGCNDNVGNADGYADIIQKGIQVKPEGFPVEKVDSEFVCRKTNDEQTTVNMKALVLPEPSELVNGSARAWTTVTGDIMAPALSNLEKLLKQPTGCGEQNMMGMVPNIYLLKYLNGKGANAPEIEAKAKKYMKIGYDREQKYRFPDGSYSVWGPKSDNVGSMWLTSFVVKAFVQASQYINVDKRNVEQSMTWILKQQGEDGCFQNKGYALHRELKGDQTSLSASILVTLIEAKHIYGRNDWALRSPIADKLDMSLEKAYECVKKNISINDNQNIYLRSIVTYASTLYGDKINVNANNLDSKTSKDLLDGLISVANTDTPGKLFWTTGEGNKARDVEITAYNVLSLTMQDKLAEALKAIRWLATNRNSYGGFVSTQDTMIALQAISEYSLKIGSEENKLAINVGIGNANMAKEFTVTENNKLILQQEKVGELSSMSDVIVKASGNGCFMVQTILRYNIQTSPNKQAFNLVVKQEGEGLTVCANYTENKEADMVVIEIELLSGYTPYLKSLENLFKIEGRQGSNDINYSPVKKYEYDEKERKVVLYYDEMSKETSCYDIMLKKVMDIKEIKPAIATIYDYYNSKSMFSTSYTI